MDTDASSTSVKRRKIIRFDKTENSRVACIDEDDYSVVCELYRYMGESDEWVRAEALPAGVLKTHEADGRVFSLQLIDGREGNDVSFPLHSCIGELEALTRLDLSYNCKSLPTSIGKLQNLRELLINTNEEHLEVLPEEIGDLASLNELTLDHTAITSLPPSIGKLQNLRTLSIYCCNATFSHLPEEIGDLASLKYLGLDSTAITSVPPSIGKLRNLRGLMLSHASGLSHLPEEIGDLTGLVSLGLNYSAIKSLPPSIGRLENLTFLNLEFTPITCLPPSIGKLQKLKKLTLSYTENLSSLPTEIGDMTSLKYLRLRNSGIASLPPSIGNLQNLTNLDLSKTRNLTSLPSNLTNLRVLRLVDSGVSLALLPNYMGGLTGLMMLEMFKFPQEIEDLGEKECTILRMLLQHCQSLGDLGIHLDELSYVGHNFRYKSTRKRFEFLYAIARNRARFRTGFGTSTNEPIANKDSIRMTPKLWPILLENATRVFDGYSCRDDDSIADKHEHKKKMPRQDAVYNLLVTGRESFVGVLLNRKGKKI